MKFIEGDIDGTPVVVESKLPIISVSGFGYLMTKSFRYGSKNCMVGTLKTLNDLIKVNLSLTKEENKEMLNN